MFRWNGAVGRQTGEDSADCEQRGDQYISRVLTTRSIILEIRERLEIGR